LIDIGLLIRVYSFSHATHFVQSHTCLRLGNLSCRVQR
jgi:hypothetical protein